MNRTRLDYGTATRPCQGNAELILPGLLRISTTTMWLDLPLTLARRIFIFAAFRIRQCAKSRRMSGFRFSATAREL